MSRWSVRLTVFLFAVGLPGCSLFETEEPAPAAPLTIRVATMHLDQRTDWNQRRPLLEAGLVDLDADVVAFQDVLSFPDATDQVDWIHRRLGFQVRFQATGIPVGSARTGLVLASRYPILETSALTLDDGRRIRTIVQSALVETPLGSLAIHHIALAGGQSGPELQVRQIEAILAHVAARHSELAPILLGDFGLPPDALALQPLTAGADGAAPFFDTWRATHGYEAGPTVGLSEPSSYDSQRRALRVDYIFLARDWGTRSGLPVSAARFCHEPDLFGGWASTHCGLSATVKYR